MDARDAVLSAARRGVEADTAEEGFARIRDASGTSFSDAELAVAVATGVRESVICDPVRLLPGRLQCCWRLELAPDSESHGGA
jgi:hypothetical protein